MPLAGGIALDGERLVVTDGAGLTVLALDDDARTATVIDQIRDPAFHDTTSVAVADDRYLVVSFDTRTPDTVVSVAARR